MQKLALIGGGGHAAVIIDLILAINTMTPTYELIGIYDDAQMLSIHGYPRLGEIAELENIRPDVSVVIAIGNNDIRQQIVENHPTLNFATLVHPSCIIGSHVKIGKGSVVMAGTIIQTNVSIGQQTIINTGSILDHDVTVGNFTHLAQRTTLAGGVVIGDYCLIGAGTTVQAWQTIENNRQLPTGSIIMKGE